MVQAREVVCPLGCKDGMREQLVPRPEGQGGSYWRLMPCDHGAKEAKDESRRAS